MHDVILEGISKIINENRGLLKIAIRQKAKFEGWLKFELAYYLECKGMDSVQVESEGEEKNGRSDISFIHKSQLFKIELKTSNTNWRSKGIDNKTKPITKNIDSIIKDTLKLNSPNGIVAFVLFPIPIKELGWMQYITRIMEETGAEINKESNYKLIEMDVNDCDKCEILVCTFLSAKQAKALQ
jgi:hypothetical protein